ncbi:MAG: FKBP-type peptidyl-prolyl cis-trans isomerase [Bacteroidia bacterium]|nr:FKBP-type peptidyl-prolyl cis-trans isomerase [Bacteroidia bacterium]
MAKYFFSFGCITLLFWLTSCNDSESEQPEQTPVYFGNHADSLSYALGVFYANDLEKHYITIDPDLFHRAMLDELYDDPKALQDETVELLLAGLRREIVRDLEVRLADLPSENRREELELYLQLKDSAGVVTLPDSLQYRILHQTHGPRPHLKDTVELYYAGYKANFPTPFEKTDTSAAPRRMMVSDLIEGLQKAVLLMSTGERWKVYIPSHLAYGKEGLGELIEPNEMLIYEVELVRVRPVK